MTIRRLDHVAVLVQDTNKALLFFRDGLGLGVATSEEVPSLGVRLTYLDCGNVYLQLVEPTIEGSELWNDLGSHGERIHHVCFGVDDVLTDLEAHSDDGPAARIGQGRGRMSAFLPGAARHGTRVEFTEFKHGEDVLERTGWLV